MKLKELAYISLFGGLISACSSTDDVNVTPNTNNEVNKEYAQGFSTFKEIKVNIKSTTTGACYSIYYEYPYGEGGSIVKAPFLIAKTPISTELNIPKDVDKLYIVGEGNLIEKNVADLDLSLKPTYRAMSSASRLNGYPDDLDGQISTFFSESMHNVQGGDLYTNLDLKKTYKGSDEATLYDSVEVKLTYLGDGGIAIKSNTETSTEKRQWPVFGKIWAYTYPVNATMDANLINNVVFYGLYNGKLVKLDSPADRAYILSDANAERTVADGQNVGKYLLWSGDAYKNNLHYLSNGDLDKSATIEKPGDVGQVTVKLPVKENGQQLAVGFIYKSNSGDYTPLKRFSTPCLNAYRGPTTVFSKLPPFSPETVINAPITHVIIQNFVSTEDPFYNVNVLGAENRAYDHPACDFDYNDMLVLVESHADFKPCCKVVQEQIPNVTCTSGTLTFEDNYPAHGDFDFNDVVVRYLYYNFYDRTDDKKNFVQAKLFAYGCDFTNEFGFRNGTTYIPFFKNIKGYFNVNSKTVDTLNVKIAENYFGGNEFIPYLRNENTDNLGNPITKDTYNTADYPYVLDIADKTCQTIPYRWCLEKKPIDSAYFDIISAGWYNNIKDATLIVDR